MESAEIDLGSIEQILQREDLTPVAAFHSQQCVEKYPGELGLLPNGKPTREDAQRFYRFAQSLYEQIKQMLTAGRQEVCPLDLPGRASYNRG